LIAFVLIGMDEITIMMKALNTQQGFHQRTNKIFLIITMN